MPIVHGHSARQTQTHRQHGCQAFGMQPAASHVPESVGRVSATSKDEHYLRPSMQHYEIWKDSQSTTRVHAQILQNSYGGLLLLLLLLLLRELSMASGCLPIRNGGGEPSSGSSRKHAKPLRVLISAPGCSFWDDAGIFCCCSGGNRACSPRCLPIRNRGSEPSPGSSRKRVKPLRMTVILRS